MVGQAQPKSNRVGTSPKFPVPSSLQAFTTSTQEGLPPKTVGDDTHFLTGLWNSPFTGSGEEDNSSFDKNLNIFWGVG